MSKNTELELALQFIEKTDRNLFLTGKAGTGKTTFLHQIKSKSLKRLVVVAPTGVAAINAKGVTIHSFFQLPFGPIVPNTSSSEIQRKFSKKKIEIIKSLDLVIIDEISMVRVDVLDGIDEVLRRYRDKNKVFGGAQVLMIGDLQQLSPVVKPNEWQLLRDFYKTAYFFSSYSFVKANVVSIELKHIYRQSNKSFITILNEIRNNKLTEKSAELLNKQYNPNFTANPEEGYITLTTHSKRAQAINISELNKLTSKSKTYKANVWANFSENNFPTEEKLVLKEGAQVMFIKNDSLPEKRFFNGKIGTVIGLEKEKVIVRCGVDDIIETTFETWENIQYSIDNGTQKISEKVVGSFSQIPLQLAWAITIHKSQGLTFDKAIIDAEDSFAHGQTYVALSRCKSLEGIVLKTPIKTTSIINDVTVSSFNKKVEESLPDKAVLNESEKIFQLNLIEELFNYYSFLHPVNRLIELYHIHKNSLHGTILQPLETIKDKAIVPLLKVANGFKKQLKILSETDNILPEKSELIQERFKKAVSYFIAETTDFIKAPLESIHFTTDNKNAEKEINKHLETLQQSVTEKLFCFNGLNSTFSTKNVLELRAKSVLQVSKKRKTKTVSTNIKHSQLFEQLRELRDVMANAENTSHYQIFTQKTLYELCEVLPLTTKQLRKIHGLGKVRIEKYGEEILEVIQDYCIQNKIEKPIVEQELPIKINTKQISFNLYKEGLSIQQIADKRGLVTSTIEGHLAHFIEKGELKITELISEKKIKKLQKIVSKNKFESLNELKEEVGDAYSYGELRMILSHLQD